MSAIFGLNAKRQAPDPKVFVSTGELPPYIDPKQPPTKKSPWKQISDTPYVKCVTMTMPDELYTLIWRHLEGKLLKFRYAKVIMKLEDVLDGEFFNEYVKRGNILMLSAGQSGIDNTFSLRGGILRLNLDRQTYERVGLQGQPVRSGGRKHVKERFLIEIDLRQPSMLHGKKGFEKVVWASKNVLSSSLLWLFHDLNDGDGAPLMKHHPTIETISPRTTSLAGISVPPLISNSRQLQPAPSSSASTTLPDAEDLYSLLEYLDLITLSSPLIRSTHTPDHQLARYSLPPDSQPNQSLKIIQWTGLISCTWVRQLLLAIVKQWKSSDSKCWFAMSVAAHQTETVGQVDGCTVLVHARRRTAGNGSGEMQVDEDQESEGAGRERFTCFQFVDS